MSLISDALKKARQEAARQDAAQRGLPYAVGGAEAKRRSALAGPLVAGLAAGAVLVGAGALAAYFGHWGPWREAGGERLAQASPAAAAPASSAGGEAGARQVAGAGALPPSPEGGIPAASPSGSPLGGEPGRAPISGPDSSIDLRPAFPEAPVAPPARAPAIRPDERPAPLPSEPLQDSPANPASVRAAPAPAIPSAPLPQAPRSGPPSDPAPPAERSEERVYTGEVPVPGGGTLRLSGIAFSDNPVAVIDGKIVGRGEVIQGFTIVEIQRGRVRLEGHGQSVVVSVR